MLLRHLLLYSIVASPCLGLFAVSRTKLNTAFTWETISSSQLFFKESPTDSDDRGIHYDHSSLKSSNIYFIANGEHHRQFLEFHKDTLVVIKYYSVSCKACQTLAPKFRKLVRDIETLDRSIIFAEMASTRNKNFLQETLKLQALPSIQIYAGEMLLDSFPCPPEKTPKLLQAMKYWVLQGIKSTSKTINFPLHWDSLPPPSSFLERDKIMSYRGNTEFFESDVSGDNVSDQIQQGNDLEVPRNNVIASPGASEFFSIACDADIPLQLSDLFLSDDDDDVPT